MAIRGQKDGVYRYWIIAQSVLNKLILEDQSNETQNNIKLEGLLIFNGNELIMRDHLAQPQAEAIFKNLGKRSHSGHSTMKYQ